jgi:hypothetical protein
MKKKLAKNIILLSILLTFNSVANEREDLDKYQFEYDSIVSQEYMSSKDQMLANELIEKINDIKKNNPDIGNNENSTSSIIDDISKTKDFNITSPSSEEDRDNLGINDNFKNNLGINDNLESFSLLKLNNKINGDNPLTRDQEDACGAILCLSSSTKPSECASYLTRYFAIKIFKHGSFNWSKTVKARRHFLEICPIDEKEKDRNLDTLVNDILPNQRGNCTADELNAMTDKSHGKIRTINKLPTYCEKLAKHSYTDFKVPSYSCDSRYYTYLDWKRGYYLEETDSKTYKEWIKNGNPGHIDRNVYAGVKKYYKHLKVVKKCWFDNK